MSFPQRYLRTPRSISPRSSIAEAARAMKEYGVGSLVVVEEGRPVGMVTDRDIALCAVRADYPSGTLAVEACMTSPAATVNAGASLLDAARVMRKEAVRRLPIVDGGGVLLGIVTADDLVGELARDLHWVAETTVRGLENEAQTSGSTGSIFGKE